MGPEPAGGVSQDGAFHAPGIFLGDPIFGLGARGVGEELKINGVMPATFAPHVGIDHGKIHLYSQSFGAVEHGGVAMEKRSPIVQIRAAGGLIGNENEERRRRTGAGGANQLADDVFFGHATGAEARPKGEEESVKGEAIQRTVDLANLQLAAKTRRKSGEPFPIAVMAHDEDERFMSGVEQRADHLRITQVSTPEQLLV